jgi:methionyl-tRNA formyltransferase
MGTSAFGIPCLDYLSGRDDIDIALVVTKPRRPSGRGRALKDTPVKEAAIGKKLNLLETEDIKSEGFKKQLKDMNPDLSIVAAYGKILPKEILDIPEYGSINIHASLLPKYRGPCPINWAIINGDTETGVSSFLMDDGLDTGPIINTRAIPIEKEDDARTLEEKLKELAVEVLADTLDKITSNNMAPMPQNNSLATFAPKITNDIAKIDWSWAGEKICNLIRGLCPKPGAYTFFARGRFLNDPQKKAIQVKIWHAHFIKGDSKKPAGEVNKNGHSEIMVSCRDGLVAIDELQPAGKNKMKAKDFWSGYGR